MDNPFRQDVGHRLIDLLAKNFSINRATTDSAKYCDYYVVSRKIGGLRGSNNILLMTLCAVILFLRVALLTKRGIFFLNRRMVIIKCAGFMRGRKPIKTLLMAKITGLFRRCTSMAHQAVRHHRPVRRRGEICLRNTTMTCITHATIFLN